MQQKNFARTRAADVSAGLLLLLASGSPSLAQGMGGSGRKPLLVAYAENGKTIKNAFRLIIPNDKHGGRDVRDLVSIEVR